MKRFFVIQNANGLTVPLHLPNETMRFYDNESAELMLIFIRRLGHSMKDFYVEENTGKRK